MSDVTWAFPWIERLIAVSIVIDALEHWQTRRHLGSTGILRWQHTCSGRFLSRGRLFGPLCASPNFPLVYLAQVLAALILFAGPMGPIASFALGSLLVFAMLVNLRLERVIDGTHRLTLPILGALFLQTLSPRSNLVARSSLAFIAGLSCLSYVTAGFAKLWNPDWRSGGGLLRTLQVPALHVPESLVDFGRRRPHLLVMLDFVTLAGQCTFPLVLVVGKPWLWGWLIFALTLHIANAFLFGYNRFPWVWAATFPAILAIAR